MRSRSIRRSSTYVARRSRSRTRTKSDSIRRRLAACFQSHRPVCWHTVRPASASWAGTIARASHSDGSELRAATGADYALFTYVRDTYATGGRTALRVLGFLAGAAVGQIVDIGGGQQVGVAATYSDILDKHQLGVDVRYGIMSQRFSYNAQYVNRMFGSSWMVGLFDQPTIALSPDVDLNGRPVVESLYLQRLGRLLRCMATVRARSIPSLGRSVRRTAGTGLSVWRRGYLG